MYKCSYMYICLDAQPVYKTYCRSYTKQVMDIKIYSAILLLQCGSSQALIDVMIVVVLTFHTCILTGV